jgi:hypothetical protein
MIRVTIGGKLFEMSWASAQALHTTLGLEIKFEDMKWQAEVRAMFAREEARRLKKEWRQFTKFWAGETEIP